MKKLLIGILLMSAGLAKGQMANKISIDLFDIDGGTFAVGYRVMPGDSVGVIGFEANVGGAFMFPTDVGVTEEEGRPNTIFGAAYLLASPRGWEWMHLRPYLKVGGIYYRLLDDVPGFQDLKAHAGLAQIGPGIQYLYNGRIGASFDLLPSLYVLTPTGRTAQVLGLTDPEINFHVGWQLRIIYNLTPR